MSLLTSARAAAARPDPADPPDGLTVVAARHPWRWAATALASVLAAQAVHGLATNPGWDWGTFAGYIFERSVMQALLVTLELTFAGAVLGFLGGIVLAPMRLSGNPVLRAVSWFYIVVYVLAIGELFYQVQVVYGRNGRVVPLLMVATVWYVVLTAVLSVFQHYVERHFTRGWRR